ncbi:MAG: methyltransferase domain-containing protein [Dehalococcoidia bacterium]|nr:methyltransferase domain-containing protein [Dehalococcoidia bacterium]
MTRAPDSWDPAQYARFAAERAQPFYDLAALVERAPEARAVEHVVDLGCGSGELTAWLHRELGATVTLGVDRSRAMLARAAAQQLAGLRFVEAEIAAFAEAGPAAAGAFDLVFSNAALHWVPEHTALFPRLWALVAPGGQLAVQLPVNDHHPSQAIARALATEAPFAELLDGYAGFTPPHAPEWYAGMLRGLGAARWVARVQVYGHELPDAGAVVEWMRGTLLTAFAERLPADAFAAFAAEYAARLDAAIGEERPYFFTYNRLLLWARKAEA